MPSSIHRGALNREILRLALPAGLQHLLQMFVVTVDTWMLAQWGQGRPEPLAAMGVVGPLVWSLTAVLTVTAVGATAVVARRVGEGRAREAARVAASALALALGVGALVTICGPLLAGPMISALVSGEGSGRSAAETAEVLASAHGYLAWFLLLFPLRAGTVTLEAVLRAAGDSHTPLWGGLLSNIANVGLNALLIFGAWGLPEMGVAGAGLATGLAAGFEFVFLLTVLARGRLPRLRLWIADVLRPARADLRRIGTVSLPALADAVAFHSGFLVYQLAVFHLTTVDMAAHRLAINLQALAFLPAMGFQVSAASLSGRLLGAGQPELATHAARRNVLLGVLCLLPTSVLFLCAAGVLVRGFEATPEVWERAAMCLRIGALEIPFLVATSALSGTLRGAGETREVAIVALLGTWLVRVPLAWGLALGCGLGLVGVWLATVLDWSVRAGLLGWFFRRGRWRTREL